MANNIGKYILQERIGEGGFGVVFKAVDTTLDREVAVKVLKSGLSYSPDFVERFHKEARLAASLRHPNIVNVLEVGELEGSYYIVMEYLAGSSLASILESGNPLPLSKAIELAKPVAEALDYAHSKGILHRDVKPANILFSEDGRLVLTDFGLVKSTLEAGSTTTGMMMGTAEYMAPEQILGKEVNAVTDLYALGVIAYHMLTGKPPFRGNTPFEIQNQHVNQDPPQACQINPLLPEEIDTFFEVALAKDPADRFKSGRELIASLSKICENKAVEMVETYLDQAQVQMDAHEFDQAVETLKAAEALSPCQEAKEMLQICIHRKSVMDELDALDYRHQQIEGEIEKLKLERKQVEVDFDATWKAESWLDADEPKKKTRYSSRSSAVEAIKISGTQEQSLPVNNDWVRVILTIIVILLFFLFTVVLIIVPMVNGYG